MHFIEQVYRENYLTTEGSNVNETEDTISLYMTVGNRKKRAIALVNGTCAIHLAIKLAAEMIYGSLIGIGTPVGKGAGGSLYGKKVLVSDMTYDTMLILYSMRVVSGFL